MSMPLEDDDSVMPGMAKNPFAKSRRSLMRAGSVPESDQRWTGAIESYETPGNDPAIPTSGTSPEIFGTVLQPSMSTSVIPPKRHSSTPQLLDKDANTVD